MLSNTRLLEIIKALPKRIPQPAELQKLINTATLIFQAETNIVYLTQKTAIISDIHGQFEDLGFCLKHSIICPNIIQMGDFVDRGSNSLECLIMLFALKILYPLNFFVLRGNHESDQICRVYGFFDEIQRKTSTRVYSSCLRAFEALPIAAVVKIGSQKPKIDDNKFSDLISIFHSTSKLIEPVQKLNQGYKIGFSAKSIFCVHGGIAPEFETLKQINQTSRFSDSFDLMLWPDPDPEFELFGPSKRGKYQNFGKKAVEIFLKTNELEYIVRGHQFQEGGFSTLFNSVCTIWSAANYCGRCGNLGAFGVFDGEFMKIMEFPSQKGKGQDEIGLGIGKHDYDGGIDYFL
ncbi:Serine/threonine-protein phosphatase [Spironucleus salmonicida]|uniref:Serine/threonine-protein phosphatase n=1 Tax=Spironucleus salmonicida TaxID=348837 RepID=V6LDK4_9EUKA|nr:Serine/threonine-protein phosphatase [Spironucleus salmonicida]|eukprot:EST42562.1 Serine/threonine-protein phosphatase [Spironucleus salmonicida]